MDHPVQFLLGVTLDRKNATTEMWSVQIAHRLPAIQSKRVMCEEPTSKMYGWKRRWPSTLAECEGLPRNTKSWLTARI